MVRIHLLRTIVGFALKGIGLFWSFSDRFLCGNICKNTCTVSQTQACSFLLLFVGIIFIVCGYVLIIMKDKKRRKLVTKIKKAVKLTK
tara:strand:- start:498 stop:761 length:264 start_codon:yes stop_codon:yes gene_type:complete